MSKRSPQVENRTNVSSFTIDGLPLQTGDLICTANGAADIPIGEFWRLVGRMLPGEVDHVLVYVGPEGWCVEAGARGVNLFRIPGNRWDAAAMIPQRGPYVDTLVGIAYPLERRGLAADEENRIRLAVREYCLRQAQMKKPYNLNFLNPHTEDAFYCSQLPYCAYLPLGIDLNTGIGVPDLPGSEAIIFPQEIWSGCFHLEKGARHPYGD
jgi:hypothetical protein